MIRLAKALREMTAPEDRKQWPALLASSLVSGLSRSLFLALVTSIIAAGPQGLSGLQIAGILVLIVVILGADYFSSIRGREVSTLLSMRLRSHLLDRIGGANLRFVEREEPARLHYHLMHTIGVVSGAYFVLLGFANSLVTLTFNFAYIGWLSWIGLVSALLISLVGVQVHWHFERLNTERRRRLDELGNSNNACHMAYLLGYKELRLSRAKEDDYRGQIREINASQLQETVMEARISTFGGMATDLFQYLTIAAAALLLPTLAGVDSLTVMQLLAAILFTIGPLGGVVGAFASFSHTQVSMDNLQRLLEAVEATHETPPPPGHPGLPPFESLELRGVAFRFERRKDQEAEGFRIGPIDLTLRRGETLFVVGGNGSGKTVLMRLLTGLYRPTEGAILFNGQPLEEADRQAFREQFAAVFNDFFLFGELLGRRDTPRAALLALLEHYGLAGKTDFRESDGCFTTVELSTGQRKRMALTVARLERRPLLVLDEFGAEQDPEHRERFYREWLPELRALGLTVVVVSHDDRYFDAADRVVRMDFGRISEAAAPSSAS
ncbi:MAG: ATP-binding cassette domain-containing protein [Betaproteobacteria bacterium]|nr:ATP-binding cassette domain-containing protein [Betaproteobacteria bacterium]